MSNFRIGWAVIFQKDGLDTEAMKQYFENSGITVHNVVEDTFTIGNEVTGIDEDRECVTFYLGSEGITIPPRVRFELNLKEVPGQQYVYMPTAR